MSRPLIGRTVRRLRSEQRLSQQALAQRLGISPSYLNLIEHDQRNVTASLLIKLAEMLRVDLAALSGSQERELEVGLREVFSDPMLGIEQLPDPELEAVAANPSVARAVLALYRAWRVAREDASGLALPSGRRILLPNEEARDVFHERGNYFPELEAVADRIAGEMNVAPAETNHAIAERLRRMHQVSVRVSPMEDALRRYEPETRSLTLSEQLPRESRGFHMAFQIMLLEARDVVEELLGRIAPSSPEAGSLIRLGLLNYAAGCLLMPYDAYLESARTLRHDMDALSARFCVSFEQACHRLSTMQKSGARGIPFFFLRADPAGNVSKQFSAGGFPFARYGGSCPRWVVHAALRNARVDPRASSPTARRRHLPLLRQMHRRPRGRLGRTPAHPRRRHGLRRRPSRRCRGVYADGLNMEQASRRYRPLLPPLRPPELPQPRLPAAGTPAGPRPQP